MPSKKLSKWKIIGSSLGIATLVLATSITAVACSNANGKNLFSNAQTINISAVKYFGNQTIKEVESYFTNTESQTAQNQLSRLGYPHATLNHYQVKDNNLLLYIFTLNQNSQPSSPLILDIYFNTIDGAQSSNLNPIINQLGTLANDWNYIFGLSDNYNPMVLKNISNIVNTNQEPLPISSTDALNNNTVKNAYYLYYNKGGVINNGSLVISNVQNDLFYYLQNYVTALANQWKTYAQYLNIFAGADLSNGTGLSLNGNLYLQVQNTTPMLQTISINNQTINILPKQNLAIVYNFNNSLLTPNLYQASNANNVQLGYYFNNVTVQVQVNSQQPVAYNLDQFTINDSHSLNTVIENVNSQSNYINSAPTFANVLTQKLNNNTIKEAIINQINSFYNKTRVTVNNLQPILQLFLNNVTLGDFLTSIGQYVGPILNQWLPTDYIGDIIANFFSNQSLSEFVYNSTSAIMGLLNQLQKKPGTIGLIADALISFFDINIVGKSQAQLKSLVTNIESLQDTLTKLLYGTGAFGPATITAIIGLLKDLSSDPNIFQFVSQKLPLIENILKPLAGNNKTIMGIFSFLSSFAPPGTDNKNFNILSVPVLNILTNTDTNIKNGFINLLNNLFSTNMPPVVSTILKILENKNGYPDWTVVNVQAFLSNLINIKVYDTNGQPLPQISSLAGFVNNGIESSIVSAIVNYNAKTNILENLDIKFHFAFKYNTSLNYSPLRPTIIDVIKALLPEQTQQLISKILGIAGGIVQDNIQVKAGEGVYFEIEAKNQPILPYVNDNNQLTWRFYSTMGVGVNLNQTLNSLLSPNPSNQLSLPLSAAIGALGINLKTMLKFPNWFTALPYVQSDFNTEQWQALDPILNNFMSNVGYLNYQVYENPLNVNQETTLLSLLNQATPKPTLNLQGFYNTSTVLNNSIKNFLNSIFQINVFNNFSNVPLENINAITKTLIQPIYQIVPQAASATAVKSYNIQIVFPAPVLVKNSNGTYSFSNVLNLKLNNNA